MTLRELRRRATEAEARPYVGEKEPLSALKAEYEHGSQVFVAKIDSLAPSYSGIRRARGDGNCFYRSVMKDGVRLSSRTHLLC